MSGLSTVARIDLCAQIGTLQRENMALLAERAMMVCELATLPIGSDWRTLSTRLETMEERIEEYYDAINAILEKMES